MGNELTRRRQVLYSTEAGNKMEDLALRHPYGRDAIFALELALSRNPSEEARTNNEKRYVRSFCIQVEPPIAVDVAFDLDWNVIIIDKFEFTY